MRIALIYPYFLLDRLHEENIDPLPMGLYSIAALLREHGCEVDLHNWHDVYRHPERVSETLLRDRPDILGVSIFHGNRWGGLDVADLARELLPDSAIVFGGVGATFLWELLLTHFDCVDAVVLGEGEETFLELVQALERARKDDAARSLPNTLPDILRDVPGLALRIDGKAQRTAERPFIHDLDALPNPARHFSYQHLSLTRGCPGNCAFCGSPRFWRRRVRSHSAAYFVEQLTLLTQRGQSFFYVSDDTFTLNRKLVLEVCDRIQDAGLNIQWAAISRVTAVDQELLLAMRRAGCVQISYGVEHGSPDIRRRLGKEFDNQAVRDAFAWTTAAAILPRAYFIYGCPGETRETIEECWSLINDIQPLVCLFYILSLFPGTELYEDFKRRSGATDDIWLQRNEDMFYFETDPDLSQEQVVAFGRELKLRYFQALPSFARAVRFLDDPALAGQQADFLSRLGLTFISGDYARNEAVPDKPATAGALFERALSLAPDPRAHWGLGLLLQGQSRPAEALEHFQQALPGFSESPDLRLSLAHCLVALGRTAEARDILTPAMASPRVRELLARLG